MVGNKKGIIVAGLSGVQKRINNAGRCKEKSGIGGGEFDDKNEHRNGKGFK